MDLLSKSDPLVALYVKPDDVYNKNAWVEYGRTEVIK